MLAGYISQTILQEALRRSPNHKAAGPDRVSCIILKYMPPICHETNHFLFQILALTGLALLAWLHNHAILLYKKKIQSHRITLDKP